MKWWLGAIALALMIASTITFDAAVMVMSAIYWIGFLILDRLDEK